MAKVDQIRAKAAEYFQKGEYEKSVAEYKKVLELEPGNASTYNFIGDAYVKFNNINDAVASYLEAAKGYSTDALFNNAIAVCKKILRVKKDDAEVYKTLGELYIQQGLVNEAITNLLEYADRKVKVGRVDEAFPVYHQIVELNPRNLTIRSKLADMYLAQKRMPEAIAELSEVAQGYREQGRHIEAEALEAKVRGMKGEAPAAAGQAPEMPAPPAGTAEISASTMIEELTQPKIDVQQPWRPAAPAPPAPSAPEITIEREVPPAASSAPPKQDWTTNIELGDLLMEIGSTQEALDQYHTAANGFLGDGAVDRAVEVYKRIADIQPLELRSRQKLVEIGLQSGQTAAIIDAYLGLAECLRRRELKEQAAAIYQKVLEMEPVNETALENLSLLLPELPEGSVELPGMQVQPEASFAGLADLAGTAPPPAAAPAEIVPTQPQWSAPAPVSADETPAPDSFMIHADEQASAAAAEVPAAAPGDGEKVSWGREIVEGGRQSRVKFSMGEDTAPKAQEEFLSLNDILAEFKEGVYQNMSQEDFQGHYDLGIAYKEMGLLEESIGEFQLASKGEKERLKSFEMLGLCFMERGEYKFAIKQFERGLATPGYPDEDYMGCRYNLGVCYEAIGDIENASKAFEAAYMVDVGFKDVAKKYQELKAQAGAATPAAPPPAAPQIPARPVPAPVSARPAPTPQPTARPAAAMPPQSAAIRPSFGQPAQAAPVRPSAPLPGIVRPAAPAPAAARPLPMRPTAPAAPAVRPASAPVAPSVAPPAARPPTGRAQVSLSDIQAGGVVMPAADGTDGDAAPKPKPIPSKLKKPEKQRISYV
ncbi:MAG: tetratricopeptide repeat protein [Candidatus Edwardsbacteria bacterium]|nr:tetratricopeptide repeat protein [Candidatus Edwardsbacteria bacterium]